MLVSINETTDSDIQMLLWHWWAIPATAQNDFGKKMKLGPKTMRNRPHQDLASAIASCYCHTAVSNQRKAYTFRALTGGNRWHCKKEQPLKMSTINYWSPIFISTKWYVGQNTPKVKIGFSYVFYVTFPHTCVKHMGKSHRKSAKTSVLIRPNF